MAVTHDIDLELNKSTSLVPPRVVVRVGDVGTQTIRARITNGGAPYTPGGSARLDILKADGTWARCSATAEEGYASCTLPSQAVSSPGMARLAHFVFFDGESSESTEGFELRVLPEVDSSDPEEAAEYYDGLLTDLYVKWDAYEKRAEQAESGRQDAEEARRESEKSRAEAEALRADAEDDRASAETARAEAEEARRSAESARSSAEASRQASEASRAEAEDARESAELSRSQADADRESRQAANDAAQAKNNADQALNNQAAQGLQVQILAEGQYDTDTHEPTVEGAVGKLYFVPVGEDEDDAYIEWMWINGNWERVGMSNATIEAITTDQVDSAVADNSPQGEQVLNLTGLSYLWAKIKGAFAALSHKHDASDIESGALPIARGGTGSTTAEAARTALGAASQAEVDEMGEYISCDAKRR